jgi:hypothetical protein
MISRIDGLTTSVAVKAPIKIMTSSSITLFGEQTINAVTPDGTAVSATVLDGDRVGVNGQADQTTNGIYIARSTAWQRAKDFDGSLDAVFGTLVTDSIPLIWRLITPIPVLFGTSNIKFETEEGFNQGNMDLIESPDGFNHVGATLPNGEVSTVRGYFDYITGDDYTIIRPSLRRISTSLCDIANSLNGVITGDSLSISGFDYPVDWPTLGGGYATENPFGLSSWPHLVRDLCLTVAPAFVPIEDVNISTDADKTYLTSNIYNYAINQKVVNFYFSTVAKKLILQNAYTGAKCLVISYVPVSDSCIFEVDGVEYNNASPDGHYQSHGYMFVPHDGEYATVTNVRYASGTPGGNLWFYGVGDGQRRVPKLTGKGAWTSGQILAEYSTLVAPYSPDYIFYIIGANDIGQGVTVEAFCNNLVSFINLARAAKPHCEIILMSTPPTSSYDRVTAKRYIKGMRKVADDNACSLIDMHSQLEQIDPSYYRYDNIHFNRLGDTIVFNILKNLVFPDVPLDYGKFLPVRQALIGIDGNFSKVPVARTRLTALVQCAATPTLVSYLGTQAPGAFAALSMVYSGTGTSSILNITPPAGWVVDSIEDVTIGSATAARVKIQSIGASNVVTAGAMTSAANVDIINSGLYALVNYRQI